MSMSDVLSDVHTEMEQELATWPDCYFDAEVRALMQVMDAVRGVLDTSPSIPPHVIAEKEAAARDLLPRFHPGCGCLIPPDAGDGTGWHRWINHPEAKSAEQYDREARIRIDEFERLRT